MSTIVSYVVADDRGMVSGYEVAMVFPNGSMDVVYSASNNRWDSQGPASPSGYDIVHLTELAKATGQDIAEEENLEFLGVSVDF